MPLFSASRGMKRPVIEDYGSKINYSLAVKKYQPEKKERIVSDILSTVVYIVEKESLNTEQIEELSQTYFE